MKVKYFALAVGMSMSGVSYSQDLVSGLLGNTLSLGGGSGLNLLGSGLPTATLLGGVTPVALDLVNSALPIVNGLVANDLVGGGVLPVLTGLTSTVGGMALPLVIETANTAVPMLDPIVGSGALSGGIPIVSDLAGGLLPVAIDLLNTASPILGNVL